jgi:hypothetical protein
MRMCLRFLVIPGRAGDKIVERFCADSAGPESITTGGRDAGRKVDTNYKLPIVVMDSGLARCARNPE